VFYLVVAVTVAIVSTLLNLLLTFGVIRKLRVHDALLTAPGAHSGSDATLPVGSTVATVAAATVGGRTVSSVHRDGTQLVGFFSPGCGACEERIPEFVRYHERSGIAALAVVVADAADSEPYVARLPGHVDVVVEPQDGPFGAAFGVTSYPALCLVDQSGVILAGGNSFQQLPEFIPA
jgi:thiol-disulfide isomerase/thioredoxin